MRKLDKPDTTPTAGAFSVPENTTDLKEFAKHRLDALGISPALAEKTSGVPTGRIRNLLRGRSPTYDTLLQIFKALHLRPMLEAVENADTGLKKRRHRTGAASTQPTTEDVYLTYCTTKPRAEIVDRLRRLPEEIIAETIDEMFSLGEKDDADDLRALAFEAGHQIWRDETNGMAELAGHTETRAETREHRKYRKEPQHDKRNIKKV